ncbi:MAG: biotin carboxylase N-terminal domain-containing protein [Archangium sp.]
MARVRKILVGADGVTAVRVTRTVQELGLEVAKASSFDVASLIERARETGADSIHPGNVERVELAKACEAAGLTFIGCPVATLEKIAAISPGVSASALTAPHRVVFQVFADTFGQAVHLNEREGSGDVVESPSTVLTVEQRAKAGALAVKLARELGVTGAASVEFFVDAAREVHFSRISTGLPVEHAVTEWVTGIDFVTWQIHVAQGGLLPLTQPLQPRGHSVAVKLSTSHVFSGPFTRSDPGTLSVWAPTRPEAVRKLRRALAEAPDASKIDALVAHETFMRGDADVAYFGAATT